MENPSHTMWTATLTTSQMEVFPILITSKGPNKQHLFTATLWYTRLWQAPSTVLQFTGLSKLQQARHFPQFADKESKLLTCREFASSLVKPYTKIPSSLSLSLLATYNKYQYRKSRFYSTLNSYPSPSPLLGYRAIITLTRMRTTPPTAYQIPSKSIENCVRYLLQTFLPSHTSVTLKQGQCHRDYNQNVEFSSIYHHARFEKNQLINIRTQANVTVSWCSQ